MKMKTEDSPNNLETLKDTRITTIQALFPATTK
jgi:hypothetical protein